WPETRGDELVRVRLVHDVDVHVRRAPARVRRTAPTGKSRAGEIEPTPEELHRTGFAEEVRAEAVEDDLRSDQNGVEPLHLLAVVGPDLPVLEEWESSRDFDRDRHDAGVGQAEPSQLREHLAIEIRDRHRPQRDHRTATAARDDDELVVDEVEVDL